MLDNSLLLSPGWRLLRVIEAADLCEGVGARCESTSRQCCGERAVPVQHTPDAKPVQAATAADREAVVV